MGFDLKAIAGRLQEFRKALEMTQKEFSAALEISQSSYCEIEGGNVPVRFEMLYHLVMKYDASMKYLFSGEGPMYVSGANLLNTDSPVFSENREFIADFLRLYERSNYYRHTIMSRHFEITINMASTLEAESKQRALVKEKKDG